MGGARVPIRSGRRRAATPLRRADNRRSQRLDDRQHWRGPEQCEPANESPSVLSGGQRQQLMYGKLCSHNRLRCTRVTAQQHVYTCRDRVRTFFIISPKRLPLSAWHRPTARLAIGRECAARSLRVRRHIASRLYRLLRRRAREAGVLQHPVGQGRSGSAGPAVLFTDTQKTDTTQPINAWGVGLVHGNW